MVLLTKKAVETYLYCVPFAITMDRDRFGMAAASESYAILSSVPRVHIAQCPTSIPKDQTTAQCFQVTDTANRWSGKSRSSRLVPRLPFLVFFFFTFQFAFSPK